MNVDRFLSKIHELDDMTLGNRPFILTNEIWGPLLEPQMSGWRGWSCNSTYRFSVFLWGKNRGRHGSLCPFKNQPSKPAPGPANTRLELPLDGFCRWTDLFLQTGRYALQMNVVLCSKHVGPRGGGAGHNYTYIYIQNRYDIEYILYRITVEQSLKITQMAANMIAFSKRHGISRRQIQVNPLHRKF